MKYDPLHDPNPTEWLALDEQERMILAEDYHRRKKTRLPNARVHAIIHTVVENQVALGDQYAAKAVLLRLMNEGLDRHEAVHAIGSVLAGQIYTAMKGQGAGGELAAEHLEKLKRLTAASWRNMGSGQS